MMSYTRKYIEGKKYSQDDLIPVIVLILGVSGGRAHKKYVEEKVYDLFRNEFSKDLYHKKVANYNVPRWKHDIAWAKERAKQIHNYMKSAKESGRGTWELSSKGKEYFEQLLDELKKLKNDDRTIHSSRRSETVPLISDDGR